MKMNVSVDMKDFYALVKTFPDLRMAFLAHVSKQGREMLRFDLLSGQALKLKSNIKDKRGRYLVSGRVGKRSTVTFSSYPTNLFERGRTLRDGKKEPGQHIIKRQFKGLLGGRIQTVADRAYNRILRKHMD